MSTATSTSTGTTTAQDVDATGGAASSAAATSEVDRTTRRRRIGRLSLTGAVLGIGFAAMSTTPSLVPRSWLIQVLLTALCVVTGYGLGAFLGWAYRVLRLPDLPARARRVAWQVLAVVTLVGLLVLGWFGRVWQGDQQALLGMERSVSWLWVAAPLVGVVAALLLLGVGRLVKGLGRLVVRPLRRVLPVRVAWLIAIVVTAFVAWTLLTGVLIGNALAFADGVFAGNNDKDKPGVVNPDSSYRSGGPESTVPWESLGREGRAFVWGGTTATQVARVVGDPAAVEPVRVFVGLETAPTPEEQAQVAVAELRALGGFERGAIAVAGATGSGWIDPEAAAALEYATHGDVATVAMQYSYLPSWMSFLVDTSRAETNAETLITALRVELDGLPAETRPELYVFGESLGAFSTGSAFTSVEDMSTTTDGALLIGPPSFDTTWQKVVAGREDGSPVWKPRYGGGNLVRVAADDRDLTDQTQTWTTDNPIIYLAHASDPIVAWTADHQAWLDPRGPDVSPRMVAWPVVAVLQATIDQFGANGVPPGHGHVYDETVVTAWSEIVGPPSLPAAEVEAIRNAVADLPR